MGPLYVLIVEISDPKPAAIFRNTPTCMIRFVYSTRLLKFVSIFVKVISLAFAGALETIVPVTDLCSVHENVNHCFFASGKIHLDYYDAQVCICG